MVCIAAGMVLFMTVLPSQASREHGIQIPELIWIDYEPIL
jgi:hypothetical protein